MTVWVKDKQVHRVASRIKKNYPVASTSEVRAEGDPWQGGELHRQKMPSQGNHDFSIKGRFLPYFKMKFSYKIMLI